MRRSRGNKSIRISWINRKGNRFRFLLPSHKSKFKSCLLMSNSNISNRFNTSLPSRPPQNPNIKTPLPWTPPPTPQSSRQPVALTSQVSTNSNEMKTKPLDSASTVSSQTPKPPRVKSSPYSPAPVKKTSVTRSSLRSSNNHALMSVPMAGTCKINSITLRNSNSQQYSLRSSSS